ncbi:uncharacterized protein LOC101854880 [Aplysia californica]|uniref:Uncharacterized protein LOC101854880 n=1 Tax=Aplysia californica TaxID=6500 RepID=A0ABM0JVC4_APLCA|nr:uncharacterized protein LOC101854880 [Aplysia californica]
MHITKEDVLKKLAKLNPNKAQGPDNIPSSILKQCATELAAPLATLMNRSLQEGVIPSEWKLAHVSPIFKKGKKDTPGNYRPDDLNRLQLWSDAWQLRFNAEKCKVMYIGKNRNPCEYKMTSKGERITLESVSVSLEKDLGVNIDSDLKFSKHVSIQVNKANNLLALIRRGFTMLDKVSLSTLYKSMIRPHLEYGNVVWYPRLKGDEEQLEKVQRLATN